MRRVAKVLDSVSVEKEGHRGSKAGSELISSIRAAKYRQLTDPNCPSVCVCWVVSLLK